jgi:acyl-[acyl-carrier-protein]-phospholipid O-acyltransferase/long-chain-fatty-acid--[acyl-carrier-protein] ligase
MNTTIATMNTVSAEDRAEAGWQKGFWSLIVTQFQGAFSDNALKQLVIFLLLGMNLKPSMHDAVVPLVGGLFSLPFILFSMYGGFLADRFSKRTISIGVKIFEIGVMTFTFFGLVTQNVYMMLTSVFFMGVHSAIFGPSKYGLLPELVPAKKLSWGNGVLELGTFLAIILGTMLGGILSDKYAGQHQISGFILIALAIVGWFTSLSITKVPAADPEKMFRLNPVGDLAARMESVRKDRPLWLAVVGNIYFSFFAMLVMSNIVFYGDHVLHLTATQNSYLNAALAIGIGLGSLAAGYLSGENIETGLIPLGAIGMTLVAGMLAIPGLTFLMLGVGLAALGFVSGFFIVPVSALLQRRPDAKSKGSVLAAANLLSFVGIFAASGVFYLFTALKMSPGMIFLAGSIMTLAGTIYCLWLLPIAFARFILWMLTHTVYRIKTVGRENIPAEGGALLVCNHVSFVDALLVVASTDRPIRFLMYKGIYDQPWIKPLAKAVGIIPISSALRPREMIKSLRTAAEAIENGDLVCIFAEGQITRIGQMLPFRRGFERIMDGLNAPIIPICLDGVWGSIFSYSHGKFVWKRPLQIPYPVTVCFGEAMRSTATPTEVRLAVQQLQSDAWTLRKPQMKTIHRGFIETARRNRSRFAMADSSGASVKFGAALTKTVFIAGRLQSAWAGQKMVGILLPPSIGATLVNFAAMLSGKVPVNLNYTLSEDGINSCIKQCGITTVVSSKQFLSKVKINVGCKLIYLEEAVEKPMMSEKVSAFWSANFMSASRLERRFAEARATIDDLATVVFSSGSTGEPKGVMLSHYNVQSNVQQLGQAVALNERDRFLGVLPFFHSFGFTATMTLPAVLGIGVVFHPNPLDSKVIGPLVAQHALTYLLATPTFLQIYLRACDAEDFGSLRFVLAAGEKLPERVAASFEEKFGIRPVEAYGCTECAPALTVNTHDFRAAGFRQVGAKRGKIGHPLPGVSIRIVDPETHVELRAGTAGLLLVRGPNVFPGYLNQPEKTANCLREGWYTTGDIAALDEDGFLQITDRLSRFSKIGGEMVPHIKIEEKLHEVAGCVEQTFAVTGVPDEKKGERLVVLHTLKSGLERTLEQLAGAGLPNLWAPKANQFFQVTALPLLGSGKLDLRRIREVALERSSAAEKETETVGK